MRTLMLLCFMNYKRIGDNIRGILVKDKRKQKDVANAIGLNRGTMSSIVTGKYGNMSVRLLSLIAKELGVDIKDLLK